MDYRDSPEVAAFRDELRSWLRAYQAGHDLSFGPHDHDEVARWHRDLAAGGYVAMSLPQEYGGRGLPDIFDAVLNAELALADAPPPPPIGHIAHAVADFAAPELARRVLPGLLRCTEPWCQGFSEPGAGSDLAAVSTSGTVDGDTVHIRGHKIWTSGAMWAERCLLLLRTEPDRPRHRGLSMIVVDLDSPGIERSAITLSTGGREFAEVFFDGVQVPVSHLVGERGQGWAVAMHMLSYERGPADMGWTGRYARDLARLRKSVGAGATATERAQIERAAVGVRVLDWHVQRTLAGRGARPDAAGSIDKLLATRVEQDLYRTIADLAGPEVVSTPSGVFGDYLYSRAQSIYGGSQQIQRTQVAQRLLGLPRP